MITRTRYAWAAPATALGLLFTALLLPLGARPRIRSGVVEVSFHDHGPTAARSRFFARLGFVAVTFGHVVLAATPADQDRLRTHERVHVAQYGRWGLLFLLAYPAESLWQGLRGRRPYWDNRFEVQARMGAAEHGHNAPPCSLSTPSPPTSPPSCSS